MTDIKRFVLAVAAVAGLGWAALLVGAPLLSARADALAGFVYMLGSLVCHQRPERSFHLDGAQLPVCARCFGLYLGGAAGILLWSVRARGRPAMWERSAARRLLVLAALPTAVTVASALLGAGDPSNAWRAVFAVPLGTAAGVIAAAALTDHLK